MSWLMRAWRSFAGKVRRAGMTCHLVEGETDSGGLGGGDRPPGPCLLRGAGPAGPFPIGSPRPRHARPSAKGPSRHRSPPTPQLASAAAPSSDARARRRSGASTARALTRANEAARRRDSRHQVQMARCLAPTGLLAPRTPECTHKLPRPSPIQVWHSLP